MITIWDMLGGLGVIVSALVMYLCWINMSGKK